MKIVAFTKSFQDWSIATVCQRFKSIGLDGVDLTARPGGMIEPKDVSEKLPLAVKAALEAGVEIGLLTTSINEVTPETEKVVEEAAKQGIGRIKLGYFMYKPFGTLAAQIREVRPKLAAIVKMCKKHGVLPCMHIHSGPYIPSHGTFLYEMIRDHRPEDLGAYVDTLHMALEGGGDGWRQGLDLVAPWIALVAVKNFAWTQGERDKFGQQRFSNHVVPIADGLSPLPEFVATLKKANYNGTYSLHSEYKGKHSFKDLDTEQCLAQTAIDLKHLKGLLAQK